MSSLLFRRLCKDQIAQFSKNLERIWKLCEKETGERDWSLVHNYRKPVQKTFSHNFWYHKSQSFIQIWCKVNEQANHLRFKTKSSFEKPNVISCTEAHSFSWKPNCCSSITNENTESKVCLRFFINYFSSLQSYKVYSGKQWGPKCRVPE